MVSSIGKDELEVAIAALPVLYGIWKIAVRPVFRKVREVLHIVYEIQDRMKQLDSIIADLKPNGGSSLRDAIDRMERTTMATNQSQRAILDLLNAGFFLTDSAGQFVYVNRYWQHITGMPVDECLGSGWANAIAPEDRDKVFNEWKACAVEGRSFSSQFRIKHAGTGVIHWVVGHSVALRDGKGLLYGHIGTLIEEEP